MTTSTQTRSAPSASRMSDAMPPRSSHASSAPASNYGANAESGMPTVAAVPTETREAPLRAPANATGTLIVGRGIEVRGEIDSCERLVVEGRVEAGLAAESLEVLSGGELKGTAEVETAEIAGSFDGTLTARRELVIRAGGKVSGTIRYARVTIESGGEISGDVAVGTEAPAKGKKSNAA